MYPTTTTAAPNVCSLCFSLPQCSHKSWLRQRIGAKRHLDRLECATATTSTASTKQRPRCSITGRVAMVTARNKAARTIKIIWAFF